MFSSPRVIAVDDDRRHLDGLVAGLHDGGVACLPIHFTGDPASIKRCEDVRIIFADLNLVGPTSDHAAQFTVLGGLLERTIAPRGPYFIVLWTHYPDQASSLSEFLNRLREVTRPFAVVPLAKADHLDGAGNVRDKARLMAAIHAMIEGLPEVAALFDWENRVLGAAGDTVSSLLALASTRTPNERAPEVGRILSTLGVAAVGKEHVDADRFRAVNEALVPILADRITNLRSTASNDVVWTAALGSGGSPQVLSQEEAARLNRMIHIDDGASSAERGCVLPLPQRLQQNFASCFGINETLAAEKQFHCNGFAAGDGRFRWVLVQAQAACDYAQSHPGPAPCYLGLELPFPIRRGGTPPAPLWTSPALELDGDIRQLRVSARFPVSIGPTEFQDGSPRYRLREQILNELIYHLHSHGARPGMLSFRGR